MTNTPKLNLVRTRDLLQQFDFKALFNELGWFQPASRQPVTVSVDGETFTLQQIAQAGVAVYEVTASDGRIPSATVRAGVQREATQVHHENILIFVDGARTQSLWYWVKREKGKAYPRDHHFVKGQPGDLFLGKLSAMVVDMSELDAEGNLPITTAARTIMPGGMNSLYDYPSVVDNEHRARIPNRRSLTVKPRRLVTLYPPPMRNPTARPSMSHKGVGERPLS